MSYGNFSHGRKKIQLSWPIKKKCLSLIIIFCYWMRFVDIDFGYSLRIEHSPIKLRDSLTFPHASLLPVQYILPKKNKNIYQSNSDKTPSRKVNILQHRYSGVCRDKNILFSLQAGQTYFLWNLFWMLNWFWSRQTPEQRCCKILNFLEGVLSELDWYIKKVFLNIDVTNIIHKKIVWVKKDFSHSPPVSGTPPQCWNLVPALRGVPELEKWTL